MKNLLSLFLLLTVGVGYAQSQSIEGRVVDKSNHPIEYFTVALLEKGDSSIIKGGAFLDGQFEIEYPQYDTLFDSGLLCWFSPSGVGGQPRGA
ncbi:hypothetical protein K5X82_13590 [Halosquirtibacter xylanolyticus]|uniref:hypothetical protein n=1 Tax=Halosquirtibacter xylanolyticus TaxID=3374599 RepID=UPI00374811C6|nr:hypothetical protein K5X82_13590 [Prolixibacteraceae bacterium]